MGGDRAAGSVTAWLQDGRVYVRNAAPAAVDVPLTGTTAGDAYGGQRPAGSSIAAGAERRSRPTDPANTGAPAVTGTARVGEKLTAGPGRGPARRRSGTATSGSAATPTACANIAGATAREL